MRKIPMTALAEGQKTWARSKQRRSQPGNVHDQGLSEWLSWILRFRSYPCCRAALGSLGKEEGAVD